MPKIIIDPNKAYQRIYKVRETGRPSSTFEISLPREVILRHARRLGLTEEGAREKLLGRVLYDSFDGVFIRFEKFVRFRNG